MQRFYSRPRGPRYTLDSTAYTWNESSEFMVLKASRTCIQESRRAVGSRYSALKGLMQNLTLSETWYKSTSLKGAWVRPTC